MKNTLNQLKKSTEAFAAAMDEMDAKIIKLDKKIKNVREELAPVESNVLDLADRLRETEHELHRKLAKAKRTRKLYLQAQTDREAETLERDYDRLMKEVNKLDKTYAKLKETYAELTKKEEALLENEMELENKKAQLYREKEKWMQEAAQAVEKLSSKISRSRRVRG